MLLSGAGTIRNTIRRNSIHSNVGKAIENINGGNGEPGHAPPVITAAGSASGTACVNCTVDVYSDNVNEGRVYHGSTVADVAGNWSFAGAVVGPKVTATATNGSGNTSEFSAPFPCTDGDADSICNSGDPCPTVADCDADGWKDGFEASYIGTDPLDACPDTEMPNDERGPAFAEPVPPWPPDFNDDRFVTGFDLSAIAGVIGENAPPAPVRRDIGQPPDGGITGFDLSAVAGRISEVCTP